MAQIVVSDIEDDVKERLERRAEKHGYSFQELIRDILRDAAKDERPTGALGSKIAELFRGHGLTDEEIEKIQELRGYPVTPMTFDDP